MQVSPIYKHQRKHTALSILSPPFHVALSFFITYENKDLSLLSSGFQA